MVIMVLLMSHAADRKKKKKGKIDAKSKAAGGKMESQKERTI